MTPSPHPAEAQERDDAPNHIWLDLGDAPDGTPFRELQEVTWSEDNASGNGIRYVRAYHAPAAASGEAVDLSDHAVLEYCDDHGCTFADAVFALAKADPPAAIGEAVTDEQWRADFTIGGHPATAKEVFAALAKANPAAEVEIHQAYCRGLLAAQSKANPAAGAEPRLTPFDAVEQALRLASMMGASIGMSDAEGAEGYKQQLRAHLVEYIYTLATSERDAEDAYSAIKAERAEQDVLWGGPEHDDEHVLKEWLEYIDYQSDMAESCDRKGPRERFVKIAALAVAAIESIDRKAQREQSSKEGGK